MKNFKIKNVLLLCLALLIYIIIVTKGNYINDYIYLGLSSICYLIIIYHIIFLLKLRKKKTITGNKNEIWIPFLISLIIIILFLLYHFK